MKKRTAATSSHECGDCGRELLIPAAMPKQHRAVMGNPLLLSPDRKDVRPGKVTEAVWEWGEARVYAAIVTMVHERHPAVSSAWKIRMLCDEAVMAGSARKQRAANDNIEAD